MLKYELTNQEPEVTEDPAFEYIRGVPIDVRQRRVELARRCQSIVRDQFGEELIPTEDEERTNDLGKRVRLCLKSGVLHKQRVGYASAHRGPDNRGPDKKRFFYLGVLHCPGPQQENKQPAAAAAAAQERPEREPSVDLTGCSDSDDAEEGACLAAGAAAGSARCAAAPAQGQAKAGRKEAAAGRKQAASCSKKLKSLDREPGILCQCKACAGKKLFPMSKWAAHVGSKHNRPSANIVLLDLHLSVQDFHDLASSHPLDTDPWKCCLCRPPDNAGKEFGDVNVCETCFDFAAHTSCLKLDADPETYKCRYCELEAERGKARPSPSEKAGDLESDARRHQQQKQKQKLKRRAPPPPPPERLRSFSSNLERKGAERPTTAKANDGLGGTKRTREEGLNNGERTAAPPSAAERGQAQKVGAARGSHAPAPKLGSRKPPRARTQQQQRRIRKAEAAYQQLLVELPSGQRVPRAHVEQWEQEDKRASRGAAQYLIAMHCDPDDEQEAEELYLVKYQGKGLFWEYPQQPEEDYLHVDWSTAWKLQHVGHVDPATLQAARQRLLSAQARARAEHKVYELVPFFPSSQTPAAS